MMMMMMMMMTARWATRSNIPVVVVAYENDTWSHWDRQAFGSSILSRKRGPPPPRSQQPVSLL